MQSNHKDISLYEEAKAGFSSLIQQTATVFVGFAVMLFITGGAPSSIVVALSFCWGTAFVAWGAQNRIKKFSKARWSVAPNLSRDRAYGESQSTKLADLIVIVFTDLVNSTSMKQYIPGSDIEERNDSYTNRILEPHRRRIREFLTDFQGREREEPQGDGFLLEFPNPILAAQFAVEVQQSHQEQPILDGQGQPIQVKIGMPMGYLEPRSVEYAARVISHARGGSILISESVYGLLKDAVIAGIALHPRGNFDLNGIGDRPLYELVINTTTIIPGSKHKAIGIDSVKYFQNHPKLRLRINCTLKILQKGKRKHGAIALV